MNRQTWSTRLIGLDWGSTHLRAYRLGEQGRIEETRALPYGVRQLPAGDFAQAFAHAVAGWPPVPVLACGMVGSRNGWREAPYLDTPVQLDRLATALTPLALPDGRTLYLVPGLREPARPDVMRGEETQLAGLLASAPQVHQVVLPGTHSKWVRVHEGRVSGFATLMTGELFGLLRQHSMLGTAAAPTGDDAAFHRGLAAARDSGAAGALAQLFTTRSAMLEGTLAESAVADYLSGLLIGDELRIALAAGWVDPRESVLMAGDAALCTRYLKAAAAFDLQLIGAPDTIAAHGLWLVAAQAGLVPSDLAA